VKNIRAEDGRLLRDPTETLNRWCEFFRGISNTEFSHPPIPSAVRTQGPVAHITNSEMTEALRKMKNARAPGPDEIPAAARKFLGDRGLELLTTMFNNITTSVTVPIWKNKGDVAECGNYRPIRLLSVHALKIFERILDARLRRIVTITPNQCGFVKGCGTSDAIHAVRILLERHREKNLTVHTSFLDLEKAFDRVPHELIWHALRSHGLPEIYVRWVKILYENTTSVVSQNTGGPLTAV